MRRLFMRLLAWHIRTYGQWAYRHEPWSFAIYSLFATLGPIVIWVAVGLTPALWLLAFGEALMLAFLFVGVRLRRQRRKQ